jgi:hypothetical protein
MANRWAVSAIALSVLSLPFLFPHVVEDFARDVAERGDLPSGIAGMLLGILLAVQMVGIALASRGRLVGIVLIALSGAVWIAGAIAHHGRPLLAEGLGFRRSVLSACWVIGLMVGQAGAVVLAIGALIARRNPGRA